MNNFLFKIFNLLNKYLYIIISNNAEEKISNNSEVDLVILSDIFKNKLKYLIVSVLSGLLVFILSSNKEKPEVVYEALTKITTISTFEESEYLNFNSFLNSMKYKAELKADNVYLLNENIFNSS